MYNINAVEVWLSLVEYYVRDVGAAGSNPVTSTNKRYTLQSYTAEYAAVVELADTRDLKSSDGFEP